MTEVITQRHYRIVNRLSQAEFAKLVNRTQQTVSRWESADPVQRRTPTLEDLCLLETLSKEQLGFRSYTLETMRKCKFYTKRDFPCSE